MTKKTSKIPFNEHSLSIVCKELIYRAIKEIRKQRFNFNSFDKTGYDGMSEDTFTSADKGAEKIILKSLLQCFPEFGLISEEGTVKKAKILSDGYEYYFTIDPLDGTRAFKRLQSHGVGSMIALCRKNKDDLEIIGAWVGDVNTEEIFYFKPNTDKVYRLLKETVAPLFPREDRKLEDSYLLLREDPRLLDPKIDKLTKPKKIGGIFKSISITDGSIGTCMARLWKGEVGAVILSSEIGMETPWDLYPTIALSNKLNYHYYSLPELKKIDVPFSTKPWKAPYRSLIIINPKHIKELKGLL